jgi:cytochrome c oxidase cbb3-type subunit 1
MTIGVVLYVASMWIAGMMQGLMWRATNTDGTLTYSFIESMNSTYPFWGIRFLGGVMILCGMFVMVWNVYRTIAQRAVVLDVAIPPPAAQPA